jgi:predicted nucleotidyltransferase
LPVKRLGIFGSSLTGSFSDSSDIDVLVVFDKESGIDSFDVYFDLKEKLEGVFNRSVDLVVEKKFRNPYFQSVVDRTRRVVYER